MAMQKVVLNDHDSMPGIIKLYASALPRFTSVTAAKAGGLQSGDFFMLTGVNIANVKVNFIAEIP